MAIKVRPLHNRLIVQRLDEDEKTRGGIIIPDTAKEKPQKGKVLAVGPGKVLENGTKVKMTVKKGDQVLFGKYAGTEITVDGKENLILKEDDILGIIE